MGDTSTIHVRVDGDLKAAASDALGKMGLTVSDAVRAMLTRVVADQALPFPIDTPNALTRAAMADADLIGPFETAAELFGSLDGDVGR
jgi:DNA-damage-inducible protein J